MLGDEGRMMTAAGAASTMTTGLTCWAAVDGVLLEGGGHWTVLARATSNNQSIFVRCPLG